MTELIKESATDNRTLMFFDRKRNGGDWLHSLEYVGNPDEENWLGGVVRLVNFKTARPASAASTNAVATARLVAGLQGESYCDTWRMGMVWNSAPKLRRAQERRTGQSWSSSLANCNCVLHLCRRAQHLDAACHCEEDFEEGEVSQDSLCSFF